MPYHYLSPKRESDPHALPDVEIFCGRPMKCRSCGTGGFMPDGAQECEMTLAAECCADASMRVTDTQLAWGYAFGFPGCLWDGDPVGPFDSEAEALIAAREAAGLCPHGIEDDEICEECPAPELWVWKLGPDRYATAMGIRSTTERAMAWTSEEKARESAARMAFCDGGFPVRLSDVDARRWGRSDRG